VNSQETNSLSLKFTILTIKDYLSYLLGKWWLYFLVILIALGISFAYLSIRPPAYYARATFMTAGGSESPLSNLVQIANQFGVMSSGSDNNLSAEKLIELMGTKRILIGSMLHPVSVEGKEDLLINHYLNMPVKNTWFPEEDRFVNTQIDNFTPRENEMAGEVLADIQKRVLEASNSENGIIRASCRLRIEEVAKHLMDRIIDEVTEYHQRTSTEKQEVDLKIIDTTLDSLKSELSVAEYNLTAWYQQQSRSLKAGAVSASKYVEQVKLDRKVEILSAAFEEVSKARELAKLNLQKVTPVIQIIDRPTFPLEEDEPDKTLIFGLSLIGLLGLTTLILILRKMIKDALRS